MVRLNVPLSESDITGLKCGDVVELSGIIYTARDAAHKYLVEKKRPDFERMLKDGVIYHCGPIVQKKNSSWRIVAAGPTTSIRDEPYEADVIRDYKVRAIIGKGGMGEKTLNALGKYKAVYLSAVGGCGVVMAESIVRVRNVYMLEEFGSPEAFWELEIKDMPLIVTMDTYGKSLHKNILLSSESSLKKIL